MMRTLTVITTVLGILAALLALTLWAARRTHNALDFVLTSRRLGPWLVSLGFAASAVNPWMLMLVGAAAFSMGFAALWVAGALLLGCIVNIWLIAPRLRAMALGQGSVTLIQVLSADAGERLQPALVRSAVLIAIALMLLQIIVALQLAGAVLFDVFGLQPLVVIVTALTLITAIVLAGGLRAVSAAEALQVAILLALVLFLPLPALIANGGGGQFAAAFIALGEPSTDWFGGKQGAAAIAFACGALGLAPALWGQPQLLNRFMSAKDEAALRVARWLAPGGVAVLLAAVVLCGWSAQVLYSGLEHPEQLLAVLAQRLLPAWLAAGIVVALASAIVMSIGGALLVIATCLAADLRRATVPLSLPWLRTALLAGAVGGFWITLYASAGVLDHAYFALTAPGAAFGPLLLVRLSGKRIRPGSTLGAMWAGFMLSLLFHLLPDSPGDFLQTVLPFTVSLGIALSGGERRRNPDRADRSQETVHDRIPI